MTVENWTADTKLRLNAVENTLDRIWAVLSNSISREQFNRMNVIRQRDVALLEDRITTLTTNVAALQEDVAGLV